MRRRLVMPSRLWGPPGSGGPRPGPGGLFSPVLVWGLWPPSSGTGLGLLPSRVRSRVSFRRVWSGASFLRVRPSGLFPSGLDWRVFLSVLVWGAVLGFGFVRGRVSFGFPFGGSAFASGVCRPWSSEGRNRFAFVPPSSHTLVP